jgi:hypothetical protein
MGGVLKRDRPLLAASVDKLRASWLGTFTASGRDFDKSSSVAIVRQAARSRQDDRPV